MDSKGAKAQGKKKDASHVNHLRPRIDCKKSGSKLSSREMEERIREDGKVDLDPFKPESSVWLKNILKDIKSKDFETRFFALRRFSEILVAGSEITPELRACFAAYVIEQGILVEVVRILRVAQSHGDFYIIGGAAESFDEFRKKGALVLSKVEVCFRILYGLMADARTVRFIRKAIPDLIDILEGAYLSLDPAFEVPGSRELVIGPPLPHRDDEKKAALEVLGPLPTWSDQANETIRSRKVLLREIMKDCMAGTDFSGLIIDRVITLFSSLGFSRDKFSCLSGEFVEVAFKSLEISNKGEVLELAITVLDWIISREFNIEPLHLIIKTSSADYLNPVLALAACPNLKQDLKNSVYNLLRVLDNKIYSALLTSANPGEEVNKLLQAQYPKALRRKQQLCELLPKHAVNQPHLQAKSFHLTNYTTLFTNEHDPSQNEKCTNIASRKDVAAKKPRRKCSRSGCAKAETDPGQFKVCSGCRLAVYCSRDCQKLAWKGGHKLSCKGGGGQKQSKGITDGF